MNDDNPLLVGAFWAFCIFLFFGLIGIGQAIGWGWFAFFAVVIWLSTWLYFKTKPAREEKAKQKEITAKEKRAKALKPPIEYVAKKLKEAELTSDLMLEVTADLLELEGLELPKKRPLTATSIEGGRYLDRLNKYIELNQNTERYEAFADALIYILTPYKFSGGGVFTTLRQVTDTEVNQIAVDVDYAYEQNGTFAEVKRRIDRNYRINGRISEYRGDAEIINAYLGGTPLVRLQYRAQGIGLQDRNMHTMVMGDTGAGKTTMIEYLIKCDLLDMFDEENTRTGHVVVIDSQRELIPKKLAKLDLPEDLITYLNPEWDLGLNLFDVGWEKLAVKEREKVINKSGWLIRFVLEGVLDGRMTDPQQVILDYIIQLTLAIPNGTFKTLSDLLVDDGIEPYRKHVEELTPAAQTFFDRDWGLPRYKQTRDALRGKLNKIFTNATFDRLFSATQNRFNMFNELQDRALILLDTHAEALGAHGSEFLGRLYIAMIVQAATRRVDESDDNAIEKFGEVFVIIDEAHEYFDENMSKLLTQARKAGIGITIAFQNLQQIRDRPNLSVDTVVGNTATQIVATSSPNDASFMAKAMRVKPDTILDLPKYRFGLYHKSHRFVDVSAPSDPLSDFVTKRSENALQRIMEERYGTRHHGKGNEEVPDDLPPSTPPESSGIPKNDPI